MDAPEASQMIQQQMHVIRLRRTGIDGGMNAGGGLRGFSPPLLLSPFLLPQTPSFSDTYGTK